MEVTDNCCASNSNIPQSPTQCTFDMRPSTPPNPIIISPDILDTPMPSSSPDSDRSFIRRIDLDRLKRLRTSTPFSKNTTKLSCTLPNLQLASTLFGQVDYRQCLSADCVVKKDPDQILSEYVNPFTPDGKLCIDKYKAQKRFNR